MKRFTKALSMLLAIVMVVGLLPLSIIADDIQTTHTVQFKLNYNGAHKIPSQKVADGECAVQPEDVTREGWIFEYWYVKTGDGIQKFDLSQPITEDVTLYARWDEDISFWGPIWSRNILMGIENSKKDDTTETPDEEEPDDDTSGDLTYEELIQKQQEELDNIEDLNGGELPEITLDEEDYIPSFIIGTYSEEVVTDYDSAIESLKDIEHLMGFENVEEEFVGQQINEFEGTIQYRLQQMYDGYPVYGKQLIVTTDDDGNITSLSGDYDPLQGVLNTEINVTEAEAYTIVSAEGYSDDTDAELVVYTLDGYNEFAWLFEGSYTVLVSAVDGVVLLTFTNVITETEQTVGRGENEDGNTVTFNTKYDTVAEKFYLHDMIRNIRYHDMANRDYAYVSNNQWLVDTNRYYSHPLLDDDDDVWNASKAVVLNQNLTNTYDYYFNTIGLRSYDGKNGAVYAFVDDGMMNGANNAFNCGPESNSGVNRTILAFSRAGNNHRNLDTVAHEFTHALQRAHVSGLVYSGETGALMEAYSDIGGELAQLYTNGTVDWIHGERNMVDPTSVTSGSQNTVYPDKYNGRGYLTEVHHNSTVISHIAYEIYNDGIRDVETLTELYFRAWNYLSSTANFLDYRSAVLAAANIMQLSDDQISIISTAFDEANIISEYDDQWWFAWKELKVTVVNDATSSGISGATVTVVKVGGNAAGTSATDDNGECRFDLRSAEYIVTASASGFSSGSERANLSNQDSVSLTIRLSSEDSEMKCEAGGKVTDALTGDALSGVTMYFRKGYNITSGRSAAVLTTGTDGKYYTDDLEYGYYTVELVKEGYIRSYFIVQGASTNWSDEVRNEALNQNISLSPYIGTDDTIRIVLAWGENPSDLDSHITGTLSNGNDFHVYFGNKQAVDPDGTVVANLDIDDVTSYGPETTTLHWSEGVEYDFYIHLFSGSGTLSSSSANIKIYSGSALIHNINVPAGSGDMRWWKVFTFEDGDFTFINTFSNELN